MSAQRTHTMEGGCTGRKGSWDLTVVTRLLCIARCAEMFLTLWSVAPTTPMRLQQEAERRSDNHTGICSTGGLHRRTMQLAADQALQQDRLTRCSR